MQASTSASRVPQCQFSGRRSFARHVARAEAELSTPPMRPNPPTPAQAPATPAKPSVTPTPPSPPKAAASADIKGVTIEYQRAQAKEMVAYFKSLTEAKLIEDAKVFGWTPANEINNGRWVMMGVGIGLLTEYATGVDFIHQLQLMISYLGILDLD